MNEKPLPRTYGEVERSYGRAYRLLRPLVGFLYPMRSFGAENVPEGPVILCANHSNYIDPLLAAFACGKTHMIHFMAKIELRRVPILGRILEKIGVVFVERGKSDIEAIRASMRLLKDGRQVFLFPEGTRTEEDNQVEAKTGAVLIAAKLHVPIVPMYIPRRKRIFGRITVGIGKPISVEAVTHEEYERSAAQVMEQIYQLRDGEAHGR